MTKKEIAEQAAQEIIDLLYRHNARSFDGRRIGEDAQPKLKTDIAKIVARRLRNG